MDEMILSPRNSSDDWIGSIDGGAPAIIAGVDDGGTGEKISICFSTCTDWMMGSANNTASKP
jgi:hypothetical protein